MERRRSLDRLQVSIKNLRRCFGNDRALDITTPRLTAYIVARQSEGAADSSIQKELAALKRAFRLARLNNVLPNAPAFPTLRVENVREHCPTNAEVAAIERELILGPKNKETGERRFADPPSRHVAAVVRFGSLTGWRRDECLELRWRDVDFAAETIRLPGRRSKNTEARTFPFSTYPQLAELLHERRDVTDAVERAQGRIVSHVFHREGDPIKDFRGAWTNACERAEVRWTVTDGETGEAKTVLPVFHDLRRLAVTNLERAGVQRSVAMKLTGHKTESVYRRYAIADSVALAEGVEKLARLHKNEPSERVVLPLTSTKRAQTAAVGE